MTAEIAVIGSIHRGNAHGRHAEDVDALMTVPGAKRIIPQVADEAFGGHLKRGIAAARVGLNCPFRHIPAAANPAQYLGIPSAVADVLRAAEPEVDAHQHDHDPGGEEEFEGFVHGGDYNRFGDQ